MSALYVRTADNGVSGVASLRPLVALHIIYVLKIHVKLPIEVECVVVPTVIDLHQLLTEFDLNYLIIIVTNICYDV